MCTLNELKFEIILGRNIFICQFFNDVNSTTLNKLIHYLLLIGSVLMGYFAFTDLQISIAIVNKSSGWANFLERFGEIPGLLVLFTGALIYLSNYSSKFNFKGVFIRAFLLLAASYLLRRILITIYSGITHSYDFLIAYKFEIIFIIILAVLIIVMFLRRLQFKETIIVYAKCSVLLGLYGYLFLVQPIKHLWGRVRFRDLDPLYSNFTSWIIPNGVNGNQSFPSGHTALAWMILPLLLLFINKKKILRITTLSFIIIWGITIGLSRIVVGAHYASDVLFGAVIIILIFLLTCKNISFEHVD